MNIYFDIDGVLKGSASPQSDVEALVRHCLQRHPRSLFWLTTHCRGGIDRTRAALEGALSAELLDCMARTFQPAYWDVLKTEAIDLSQPYIWFDDAVLHAEIDAMEAALAADGPGMGGPGAGAGDLRYGLFLMDAADPASAADALAYLKEMEEAYPEEARHAPSP